MACSAASTALLSLNPKAFSSVSKPLSPKTLTIPKSFDGLIRKPFQSPVPRSISLSRGSHLRKSFVVRASVSLHCSISLFRLFFKFI